MGKGWIRGGEEIGMGKGWIRGGEEMKSDSEYGFEVGKR